MTLLVPRCEGRLGLAGLALIASGACLAAVMPAAAQQDLRPLLERVQRMERDVSTLQQQVTGGRAPTGALGAAGDTEATAAATVRLSQLEADLRSTTGQLEEVNFSVGQLRQRLDRLVTDVDFRLQELEKVASGRGSPAAPVVADAGPAALPAPPARPGEAPPPPADAGPTLGAPPRNLGSIPFTADQALPMPAVPQMSQTAAVGGVPPGTVRPVGPPPVVRLPSGSPKDQYDYAFDLLKRAEYAEAEQALKQFVTAYPADPLAGNAQYWLAETYYVRNNYSEAASQFLSGYQKYPQSPKAADNLFKLGVTLTILGKVQEACTAFQRFDREYPSAPGALKRRVVDERARLGCA